jgi:putative ABC transport system permease protein
MRFEHRSYRTALRGIATGGILYRLLDTRLEAVELPKDGVVLTDYLAKMMGIRPGDFVTLEILEGRRPIRRVRVAGVVSEYIGVFAYMPLESVYRLLGEDTTYSGAYLDIDPPSEKALYTELKGMPRVAGSSTRKKMLTSFYETMANQMLVFAFFNTLLAATIAVGVVYNSARIALSERSRELASLRVLGFTRGEISYILLGEMGLLTIVALVPGCLLGHALSAMMVTGTQNELFRVPIVVSPSTYSFAASVVLAASIGSAIVIRRKLNRLDLVAVLKTKE